MIALVFFRMKAWMTLKAPCYFFYNEDSVVSLAQKNKTEPANQQQQQHKKTSLLAPAIVQIGVSFYFSIL